MKEFEITVMIKHKNQRKIIKDIVLSSNQEQAQNIVLEKLQKNTNGTLQVYEVENVEVI